MSDIAVPRGFWSTLAISFVTNGIGGLLWIGRPKLALALFALAIICFCSVLAGWLTIPYFISPPILTWSLIAIVTSIPLFLRGQSTPGGWLSKLVPALSMPLIFSLLTAISIRSFVFQPFNSVSVSMAPTLIEGDYFVANKSVYGYSRYSFPFQIFNFSGRTSGNLPERGEIIMFRANGFDYVKRVVGLPGETVQMTNGLPFINGVSLKQETIGEYIFANEENNATEMRETLPDGRGYSILNLNSGSPGDDTREFVVPENNYFVLGDNRDNSIDSRFDMGFVPLENLIGRAERIYANEEGLEFASRKNLNVN